MSGPMERTTGPAAFTGQTTLLQATTGGPATTGTSPSHPHSTHSHLTSRLTATTFTTGFQYIDRAEAIFATGLIHITLLFAYPSNTHRSQQWRNRFRQLHILPHTYHYHNFLSSNSAYIKLHFNPDPPQRCYHQHGHFYVGSTAIGASPTESITAVPNSNNYRTTSPFPLSFPYATGIPTTISTTTPPSNSHPTTPTTKPGSRNTTTLPTGCLPLTGPSSHTTSNSKLKDGSSRSIERTFTPD